MLVPMLALLMQTAVAGQLAGVDFSDTATVGGQQLVLNGMGLREKYFIDIYVGGLYLPARTTSASSAIDQDVPKRLVMHFIYKVVTKDQLRETFLEGLASVPGGEAKRADITKMCDLLEDVHAGEEIAFDYAPATGTRIIVKGIERGTFAGKDFMKVLWSIYLGPAPPTAKFKRGLLGS